MNQLVRILTFSPRLTIGVGLMLFGGIGGIASSADKETKKSSSAWSKDSSYDAQKRADDGWGSGTGTGSSSNNRSSGRTTQEVWIDRDGVIHEKEDMKAIHPEAFE